MASLLSLTYRTCRLPHTAFISSDSCLPKYSDTTQLEKSTSCRVGDTRYLIMGTACRVGGTGRFAMGTAYRVEGRYDKAKGTLH